MQYADYFDVSMDYLFARTDKPQGKLYEYRPKITAGSEEMKQFIEMCFDPQSPMSEKLKQMLLQLMEEDTKWMVSFMPVIHLITKGKKVLRDS